MERKEWITERLSHHTSVVGQIINDNGLLENILKAAEMITDAFLSGHSLWLCGNGGSAADAQHLAAEFSGKFYLNRKALHAEALHCNTSYVTAVANDYSYDKIYARLIDGVGNPGDILIGISTSGNSANIIKAYEVCSGKGIHTISLTGASGGAMKKLSDILINVPSTDTPRIQEAHILIGHIICEMVEAALFAKK